MQDKTERFEMRLDQETLAKVDAWRNKETDKLSRAEAIRRLIDQGLSKSPRIDDGQKLILMMLCDLFKNQNIKGDLDPSFIEAVIHGGHYWALKWEYDGLFHDHADTPKNVSEVVDILDMWEFIERAYKKLPKKDKEYVAKELGPFGNHIEFPGFDGNNESNHLHIARFLIEKMDRFTSFKEKTRSLNSHAPVLDSYRKMLDAFLPMRVRLIGVELSADQLIKLIKMKYS